MTRRAVVVGAAAALALVAGLGGTVLRGRADDASLAVGGVPLFAVEAGRMTRAVHAEGFLRAVQATPVNVPVDAPGMQRISWIAPDGALVGEEEIVIRFDPTDLELRLADGRADLAIAQRKIGKAARETEAAQENSEVDATVAERELSQAKEFASRDPRLYSKHEIVDSEIDQDLARAKADNARSRGVTAADQGRTELELLEIEKQKAALDIQRAEKGLRALEVAAPHAGMLVLQRDWRGERPRSGDQVWPGQKLAEIPDPAQMQVRGYVLEADAGGLKAGCAVTIVVEAHPDRSYPGRVERVDALAKKLHDNVPVQYFEVVLVPDETDVQTMKPGQRARAEIVLEEIDDALAVPPQAVFREEGRDRVFRRVGGRLVPTDVTLGARSLSRVQILEGLAPGDEVALRDPREQAGSSGGTPEAGAPGLGAGGMR